jgi:hypothetical protein
MEDFYRLRFSCRTAALTRIQQSSALRADLAGLKKFATSFRDRAEKAADAGRREERNEDPLLLTPWTIRLNTLYL